jgi:hypothetical protein
MRTESRTRADDTSRDRPLDDFWQEVRRVLDEKGIRHDL